MRLQQVAPVVTEAEDLPFSPRTPVGRGGGRPTRYDFYFVRADGILYPSESAYMTAADPIRPEGQRQSWAWALEQLAKDPTLWLVIPLDNPIPEQQQKQAAQTPWLHLGHGRDAQGHAPRLAMVGRQALGEDV